MNKEKHWLMRERIYREGMTIIEKIEYWFVRHGISGIKLFCKYYHTLLQEEIDKIDLDTKDIRII